MKKYLSIMLSLMLVFTMLTGCTKPSEETKVPEKNSEQEKNAGQEIDYKELYLPVLEKYCALIDEVISNEDGFASFDDGEMGVWETANAIGEEAYDIIGYALKDISGDEVPELIIGIFDKNEYAHTKNDIFAVYTVKDGETFYVLEGRSRNSYSLMEDNALYYYGSSGAAYSAAGEFYLSEDGTEVLCKEFYFTDTDDNNDVFLYRNTTGEWDSEKSELMDEEADKLWEKSEELALKTIKMDFLPLSQINETENKTEKENVTISVAFADEEELSDYTEFVADETDMQVSVLFTANGTAENFKVLGLSLKDISEDGEVTFEKEVLYEQETLTEECPLLVKMTFFGTIPSYGIAYTDSDGEEKQFSVEMSGVDGSLFLSEM